MPVSPGGGYFCVRFRLRVGLFLFCFCVLATAQTIPSREYIRLGTRVIAIEVPTPAVAAPTFSPAGGTYAAPQTVTISSATAGATIRYTLDGTTPTETTGTVGTSVIISSSATLKAIAYESGWTDSVVTSASYIVSPTANFSIQPKTSFVVSDTWTLNLTTTLPNQPFNLCFTQNGSTPACVTNQGTTDANGNWTLGGTFDSTSVGSWQEWIVFPGIAQSNTISFTIVNASATFTIQPKTSFLLKDAFTIQVSTNLPGRSFNLCFTQNGSAPACVVNQGITDVNGNWTSSGTFTSTSVLGSWQEWIVFPSIVQSNTISFTIAAYANYSISSGFQVGNMFTLSVSSDLPNQTFNLCGSQNGGAFGCNVNYGTTDANGNWTLTGGPFTVSTVGSWQEYIVFPGIAQSNTVSFTVTAYANYSISSQFRIGDMFTLSVSSDLPNQTFNLCGSQNGGAFGCNVNYGTTDANGNWTLTGGPFTVSTVGSWQEYIVFPGIAQSNTVSFTVQAPYANYSISSGFHVGNTFTLTVNTDLPNQSFNLCGSLNGGAFGCNVNFGTTDSNGNWSFTGGPFGPSDVGSWQEYIVFPGIVQSGTISFTVSP